MQCMKRKTTTPNPQHARLPAPSPACHPGSSRARLTGMQFQYTPRASHHAPRFPNRIREYRLKAGLSQRRLGALIGCGRNAISLWERGLTKPDVTLGVRMAKTLATLVESLYQDFYSPAHENRAERDAAET